MPVRKDNRGRWHIEICFKRQRVHRVCAKDTTKAQAQLEEARIRKDLHDAKAGNANRLISDALANYVENHLAHSKSYKNSICHVYRLADWVAGARLADAPRICERFKSEARESYSNATINRSIAALRRACYLGYTLEWVSDPVHLKIRSLHENNARHVYLTKTEILKLVDACKDQQGKDAILIAAYTGMRLGEMMRLGKITGPVIRIDSNTKTGKPRLVPIVPLIRPALKRLPFTYPKRRIQNCWEQARKSAKMPKVHFHDLRHSFASLLVNEGVDLYVVGQLLGHSTPQTTQRYAHLAQATLKKAMRKLG